ncbi:Ubiquitin carboxyl-terminal hydrolase 28, partial [Nibea albiflora]
MLISQLREITGIQDPQILYRALNASQGDIGHAVGLLTTQTAEVQDSGEPQESGTSGEAWEGQKGLPKDELQTAIELSLQESHNAQEEERELNRALEASAEENAARMKRKRSEVQGEMCSPGDWIRQDDWPVGIRNVGNTCWFSAVIQSLFHLPVFKRLVLNYHLSERILEKCKSHSDVSEFSHKLLDWLEDAFQLAANGNNAEDKQQNPMVQLFYGTFVTERRHEGKTLCNIEQFGQYPLQVNGFNNLDECLEGAMVEKEIESLHSEHSVTSGRERWFKRLPPVLTFELSRFEFNTQLGRPEKIHKKLEFPQIIYMDSYRNYGSGPTKYPLADMLQFVLEFATTKPSNVSPAEDLRPTSSSPTPTSLSEAISKDSRLSTPRTKELHSKTVPYRLHAVLVHEGQASAGHYWAYIYDHANQRWMKYNDINITESSWEELERDSFGGMTNASAYCLMYIDDRLPHLITGMSFQLHEWIYDTDDETGQALHGMDSLPSVLRRYVHEDNRWFQQELSEWEEQFCQTAAPQGESTTSAEPPNPSPDNEEQTPVKPAPQSGPSTEEVEEEQGASSEPQPDPEAEKDPELEPRQKPEEESELAPPPSETGCQPDSTNSAAVTDTLVPSQSSTSAEKELQSQTPGPEAELNNQAPSDLHEEKDDTQVASLGPQAESEPEASGESPEQEAKQEDEEQQQEVPA